MTDDQFNQITRQFEAITARFDAVDDRFDTIDKRFDAVDDRLNKVQADMVVGFTEIRGTLATLATGQVNLLNVILGHAGDPHAHRR